MQTSSEEFKEAKHHSSINAGWKDKVQIFMKVFTHGFQLPYAIFSIIRRLCSLPCSSNQSRHHTNTV